MNHEDANRQFPAGGGGEIPQQTVAKAGQGALDGIAGALGKANVKGPPPVHLWNPPFCGELDMRIATDGTWFYMKTPIGRPALVKLFASVIKREGDKYFLVTPVEKVGIVVDDAPFLAVELQVESGPDGPSLNFRSNVDDWIVCGAGHALRFVLEPATGGLKPYLHVRRDLWAKVTRTLFYDLVALGEERDVDGTRMFGVVSNGAFFRDGASRWLERIHLMQHAAAEASIGSENLFERVRARLTLDVPPALDDASILPRSGDHVLDPTLAAIAAVRPVRRAAVLLPIVDHREPTVLLTQRSAHLPDHPGQISFPGGKIDAGDASPLAAALREAEEEIGLDRAHCDPLGYLDLYMTTHGFRIVPLVARVKPGFTLTLNPSEVDNAFEVPLAFLMEPANHKQINRDWQGMKRTVYSMPFGERHIWGITAGILRNFYDRMYAS